MLHPARQFEDRFVFEVAEAGYVQKVINVFAPLGFFLACHARTETYVVANAHPLEERALLENHSAFGIWAGHGMAVHFDCSFGRCQEACNDV